MVGLNSIVIIITSIITLAFVRRDGIMLSISYADPGEGPVGTTTIVRTNSEAEIPGAV